jgi:hypothetical protein
LSSRHLWVFHGLNTHNVAQENGGGVQPGFVVENDTRTVQQLHFGIQLHFLHNFGGTGHGRYHGSLGTLEGVDDAGLPNVGVADDAHSDRGLDVVITTVILDELQQTLHARRTSTRCGFT